MNKLLYDYQVERYETIDFTKKVFKGFFKKSRRKLVRWDTKARVLAFISYAQLILIFALLAYLAPYYVAVPLILVVFSSRFLLLIISNAVYSPFERRILAKKTLLTAQTLGNRADLTTVAITGSSGKTSVKHILQALLPSELLYTNQNENDLTSYLDLLGNGLDDRYKYLLCDINARRKGDIKNVCQLVSPKIGILTSINEQHLSRFKTIENTIQIKFEALHNLRNEGLGIVNLDDHLIETNLKLALPTRLIGYSLEDKTSELCDYVANASNIASGIDGSRFSLSFKDRELAVETSLLGKKHIGNLVASLICAIEMGEDPNILVDRVRKLSQVPNCLEHKMHGGIHVLDDTISANVSGFKEALRILSLYEGRKTMATPGIPEVGSKSSDIHKLLGYLASGTVDLIMLIGKNDMTENIKLGALDNNFKPENIIRMRDLDEVFRFVDKNLKDGDVILLENSLPEGVF